MPSCVHCSEQVDELLEFCPHCGAPVESDLDMPSPSADFASPVPDRDFRQQLATERQEYHQRQVSHTSPEPLLGASPAKISSGERNGEKKPVSPPPVITPWGGAGGPVRPAGQSASGHQMPPSPSSGLPSTNAPGTVLPRSSGAAAGVTGPASTSAASTSSLLDALLDMDPPDPETTRNGDFPNGALPDVSPMGAFGTSRPPAPVRQPGTALPPVPPSDTSRSVAAHVPVPAPAMPSSPVPAPPVVSSSSSSASSAGTSFGELSGASHPISTQSSPPFSAPVTSRQAMPSREYEKKPGAEPGLSRPVSGDNRVPDIDTLLGISPPPSGSKSSREADVSGGGKSSPSRQTLTSPLPSPSTGGSSSPVFPATISPATPPLTVSNRVNSSSSSPLADASSGSGTAVKPLDPGVPPSPQSLSPESLPPRWQAEWQAIQNENQLLRLQVERQEKLIWELRRQLRGENVVSSISDGTATGGMVPGGMSAPDLSLPRPVPSGTPAPTPAAIPATGAHDGSSSGGTAPVSVFRPFSFSGRILSARTIGGAIALVVGVALIYGFLSSFGSGTDTSPEISESVTDSSADRTTPPVTDQGRLPASTPQSPPVALPPSPPPGMRPVAAGTYLVGNDADPYSSPPHEVTLTQPFWIDPYEVSQADYAQYVSATGSAPPPHWQGSRTPPPGTEQLPVTRITLAEAEAYARWAGKSLPTETEWEIAAQGSEPAGVRQKATGPLPVTVSPPQGRFQLYHILGNVWEWTASPAMAYPNAQSPDIPAGQQVIRGGSYADPDRRQQPWYRNWVAPDTRSEQLGFRCVWRPSP